MGERTSRLCGSCNLKRHLVVGSSSTDAALHAPNCIHIQNIGGTRRWLRRTSRTCAVRAGLGSKECIRRHYGRIDITLVALVSLLCQFVDRLETQARLDSVPNRASPGTSGPQ